MPFKTYEFIPQESNQVAVAVAETKERALQLAKQFAPSKSWASVEQVEWRDAYHALFFDGRRPPGESFCVRAHPHDVR